MAGLVLVLVGACLAKGAPEGPPPSFCPDPCTCTREGGAVVGAACDGGEGVVWGRALATLEEVVVSDCSAAALASLATLPALTHLTLVATAPLPPLPCPLLTRLTHLTLASTSLSSLAALHRCGGTLQRLEVRGSRVEVLELEHLAPFTLLEELTFVDHPLLASVRPPARPMPRLRALTLAGAPALRSLCGAVLANLPNLDTLNLTGTNLTSLPDRLLHLPHLATLLPPPHPLACTCHLSKLLLLHPNLLPHLTCTLVTEEGGVVVEQALPASSPSLPATLGCSAPSLASSNSSNSTLSATASTTITLDCEVEAVPAGQLLWVTPRQRVLRRWGGWRWHPWLGRRPCRWTTRTQRTTSRRRTGTRIS